LSLALARKYRPKNFNDLVGQEAIARTLSLALSSNKLSHAYLFSGIRGNGKTSTARIFAKALLCKEGPTATPCENCEHCNMANEGRHIDIIEMDAASNRGIEDIKELIEHTKYKPSIGRFKIFIIDEVHMLTVQAFNALLKTLEEPPEFVKFILATTDPLKLPATILSRTQHFRFKKIPLKVVKEHLSYILNKESVEFEEEALEIIARSGQGSLRDSLTLLDQAIVYSGGMVDTKTVTNMLGIVDPSTLEKLLDFILQKDKRNVLDFIRNYADFEAEMIIDELTIYLKEALVSGNKKYSTILIDRFFRSLSEGKTLLNIGANSEFVLTLTLFKMIEATNILEIDDMIAKLQSELSTSVNSANQKTSEVKKEPKNSDLKNDNQNKPLETEPKNSEAASQNSELKFKALLQKIYDRSYELGEIFEKNITFIDFKDNTLTWESTVEGEEKKKLIAGWGVIKLFVQEIFGVDTKINNIAKKKVKINKNQENDLPPINEDKNSQEQKGSCIMPKGDTQASMDKDPKELLNEPMIQEFIKHFEPKRVIVKQKV